ncbi:MAG TPA: YajG family lipoprotein [Burkholderiales bacterium]|nr:YajG family lipoprotein [Burkholderiales bacterium]
MHLMRLTLAGLLVLAAAGCTPKPQTIRVDPPVKQDAAQAAGDVAVGLAVIDLRPGTKLGTMNDAHGKVVDVSTADGSAAAIQQRLSEALARKGFRVKPLSDDDPRRLVVELRELSYGAEKRAFDFDVSLAAAVSAKANNGDESFLRTYNVSQRKAVGDPPTEPESTQIVNTGLGLALDDLLNDSELIAMLRQ